MKDTEHKIESCEIPPGEKPEIVEKGSKKFAVPIVTYSDDKIYFYRAPSDLKNTRYVRVSMTTKYIIFTPVHEYVDHAFRISPRGNELRMTTPAVIKERVHITNGVYKLYRCGSLGYCIKRDEPLERREPSNA